MPQNQSRRNTVGGQQPLAHGALNGAPNPANNNDHGKADHARTATCMKWVIAVVSFLAVASLAGAATILTIGAGNTMLPKKPVVLNDLAMELGVDLTLNIIVAVCMSSLDYVHAVSYRWELAEKRQLDWNHNFRLFQVIPDSSRHGWPMTIISAVSSMLVYASTQLIIVRSIRTTFDDQYGNNDKNIIDDNPENDLEDNHSWTVNGIALLSLGIGLGGSAVTAMVCLHGRQNRPWSWNPSALWTVKRLHDHQLIPHEVSRSMRSVVERTVRSTDPVRPRNWQPRLWNVGSFVRWYLGLPWIAALVAVVLTLSAIYGEGHRDNDRDCNCPGIGAFAWQWDLTMIDGSDYMELDLSGLDNVGLSFFVAFLFQLLLQGVLVGVFHCVELLVNLWREESDWKEADTEEGTNSHAVSPARATLRSWLTISMTLLQAGVSWIVGQAIVLYGYNEEDTGSQDHPPRDMTDTYIHFSSSRLILVSAALATVAVFATVMAFWSTRSQQPAAFGHIQTLSNLMDEVPVGTKRFYWGDKGVTRAESRDVAHAGTASVREGLVQEHSQPNRLRDMGYA